MYMYALLVWTIATTNGAILNDVLNHFSQKAANVCFVFKISFCYSVSLKCLLHSDSYTLRIGISVT